MSNDVNEGKSRKNRKKVLQLIDDYLELRQLRTNPATRGVAKPDVTGL
jgi:hypothetical protein